MRLWLVVTGEGLLEGPRLTNWKHRRQDAEYSEEESKLRALFGNSTFLRRNSSACSALGLVPESNSLDDLGLSTGCQVVWLHGLSSFALQGLDSGLSGGLMYI